MTLRSLLLSIFPRLPKTKKKEEEGLRKIGVEVELYKAALKGDWKTAKCIFEENPSAVNMPLNEDKWTALMVAVIARQIRFVENLVKLTPISDLATQNESRHTALYFAATTGVVRMAKVMVDKNPCLPNLVSRPLANPILKSVAHGHKDMASYLYSKTNVQDLSNSEQLELLIGTICFDNYDIALDVFEKNRELAKAPMGGITALHVLATKRFGIIGSSKELSFWKGHINYSCFKGIYNKAVMQTLAHQLVERIWDFVLKELSPSEVKSLLNSPSPLLYDAAKVGNVEFLIILIRSYPDLIRTKNDQRSIFHAAVENRQESVFSLIYEIGGIKDTFVNYFDAATNSNILHLAGKLAPPNRLNRVSGAALQMQRELLWFKEVEKIITSHHYDMKCTIEPLEVECREPVKGLTPHELFSRQHKQLLKDGEKWMKGTANSCMLVATLITTVVFATAFTIPGGNNDKDGTPNFLLNEAFTVFVISDAAALAMSTTSILTFLSILTSRYAEEDFLKSLPSKLLFGLVTLFVSIACMVVAFSANFFIVYDKTKATIPLAIAAIVTIPLGCFCIFHFKLVVDILRSSYWSQFSLRKHKKRLF